MYHYSHHIEDVNLDLLLLSTVPPYNTVNLNPINVIIKDLQHKKQ